MPADPSVLESLSSRVDPATGLQERFVWPVIGGLRTLAVIASPVDRPRSIGWVLCHSLGAEQVYLQPLEVALARGLAASGMAALRFHGQGYGDSHGATEGVSVRSHVRDAVDAAQVLRELTGCARVGLIGARFGASVAATAAGDSGASALVLLQPVVEGERYVDGLLRSTMAVHLASRGRFRMGTSASVDVASRRREPVEVHGFPLSNELREELLAFDLLPRLGGFSGRALVVQVSASGGKHADLDGLVEALRAAGAEVWVEVVVHPEARTFGLERYRTTDDGGKADIQKALSERLVSLAVSWCDDLEVGT